MATKETTPPHAICVPYPAQGHITPMLAVAKLLHRRGFHITFVNTEFNHRRLVKSHGPASVADLPSFRFATIPDGMPPSDPDATQDIPTLNAVTEKSCLPHLKSLLRELNETSENGQSIHSPPVTCIVSDFIFTFNIEAGRELGIPVVLLWSASACSLLCYKKMGDLVDKGLLPLKDIDCLRNGYLDETVDWIPGIEGIRLKDFPSFVRTTNKDDFMLNFTVRTTDKARNASAIIVNTFDGLESETLQEITSIYDSASVCAVGPLHLLQNRFSDHELDSIGSNLWKEESGCLEWLDLREPNSVLYVNFGSIMVLSEEEIVEFAWGLANSGKQFLWVIRPDLVKGDAAVLPAEFVAETKERGFMASWCEQGKVIQHRAVGGFLTHCGWNSTLESLSAGVPMLCRPFFADQQTNCWFMSQKWGVGVEVDGGVGRCEIERLIKMLMEGEEGREMKAAVMRWKDMAETAVKGPDSLSYGNFEKVIEQVMMKWKVGDIKGQTEAVAN